MKALVKARAEPGLWMETRPVPEIGPDDVLIKIHKTGICGTDIHIWAWDDWAARTVPTPLVTGTFGKTLGGAMGGFIAAAQPIIDLLRQRARPYLFSNALAPAVAAGSLKAIEIAEAADDRRRKLKGHAQRFREAMTQAGFELLPGNTPIIPVMLGDARLAQAMAAALDKRGVYVAGFFYPVVPQGKARIRTQLSAALSFSDVTTAIDAFKDAAHELGVIR